MHQHERLIRLIDTDRVPQQFNPHQVAAVGVDAGAHQVGGNVDQLPAGGGRLRDSALLSFAAGRRWQRRRFGDVFGRPESGLAGAARNLAGLACPRVAVGGVLTLKVEP